MDDGVDEWFGTDQGPQELLLPRELDDVHQGGVDDDLIIEMGWIVNFDKKNCSKCSENPIFCFKFQIFLKKPPDFQFNKSDFPPKIWFHQVFVSSNNTDPLPTWSVSLKAWMKFGILSSTSRSEAKLWTELTSLWVVIQWCREISRQQCQHLKLHRRSLNICTLSVFYSLVHVCCSNQCNEVQKFGKVICYYIFWLVHVEVRDRVTRTKRSPVYFKLQTVLKYHIDYCGKF